MFAGDEEATREILERFHRPLYGTLVRLTRDPAAAEDLFQEAFLRALRAQARFDRSRRFKPWIFTIAVNLARDRANRLRHRASPELRASEDLPERGQPSRESMWAARMDLLRALDALPDAQRQAVELRYFEGLDEAEIAREAGIPRGTVKSRLHHALRKLRDIIGETA